MRVWSRFSIVVLLFVALLAGLGISRLESMPWFSPVWKFALLALVAVDLLPGRLASSQVSMRPIDRWIVAQPGDFSLAFVPNTPIDNYYAIYASLSHEKRMPAYIHPDHLPRSYKRYLHAIQSFPDDTAILAIRRMGIRYLILQPAYFDGDDHPSWQSVEASLDSTPRLAAAARVDEYTIYEFLR